MLNEPIQYEDKKRMYVFFFESEEGELFREILKDMQNDHLDSAQRLCMNPQEQICAQVNLATGVREVIDFIDSIDAEVKAHKEGENQK